MRKGEARSCSKVPLSVFIRMMSGIVDWDISGFQPANVSPKITSTTQVSGVLAVCFASCPPKGLPGRAAGVWSPTMESLYVGNDVDGRLDWIFRKV